MKFEFDNNKPIYIQIVDQLKIEIISGNISAGDRLPSVRDLALDMKVNPNTMQKALVELEDLRLIYTERTNGKFVTTDKKLIEKYKKQYATSLIDNFFSNMESIGYTKEETITYLNNLEGDYDGISRI